MNIVSSIVVQSVLVGLALAVTLLRTWIRLRIERRQLTAADYLVWCGWLCVLGWVICSVVALNIQEAHPLDYLSDTPSDSVPYLKTVFVGCYFLDVGLYFSKASLLAFYWWLIPRGFRSLRAALYVVTAIIACAFVASILVDTLIAGNVSDNWTIETQNNSTWNSYPGLAINWAMNITTDILLFGLPFFVISCLKLRRRQKMGLVGVFSLGVITIAISTARIIVYSVDYLSVTDAQGNAWCTGEMCTAIIVVSLPAFKSLIFRSTPANSSNRSASGYVHAGSSSKRTAPHVRAGYIDDEIELTGLDRKPSPSPTRTTDDTRQDGKDSVTVTTDITLTREAF